MPDDRVGTGRDDRLPGGDLDRRGGIAVRPDHEEVDEETEHAERVAEQREPGRDGGRPAEAVIEDAADERPDKDQAADGRDDLLCRGFLGRRTRAQAPLEQWLVVERQVDGGEARQARKRPEEGPALPVRERPSGEKNDGEEHDAADERRADDPKVKTVHRGIMLPSQARERNAATAAGLLWCRSATQAQCRIPQEVPAPAERIGHDRHAMLHAPGEQVPLDAPIRLCAEGPGHFFAVKVESSL